MSRPLSMLTTRVGTACLVVFLASACTTFSRDGGFGTVSNVAETRLGKQAVAVRGEAERDAVARQTAELLANPLSVDDAVQLALLNNRGLQAAYSELGLSEADLVQAGRLPNPGFTFSRTHWSDGIGISRSFSMSVLSVLTLPMATRIERGRFEQTKLETADAMLKVAADARRAYIEAVAAQQAAVYAQQIGDSAEAGAELARRMRDAGNASKLDYAREQAFYAQSVADVAKAKQQALAAREKLTRTMGLWGEQTRYALPDKLPDLPKERPRFDDPERFAIENRLDIQAAKLRTQSVASSLGLTKAVRFVNALDAGYLNNFETDKGHERGHEIGIEIPIFDWGSAKVARAQAIYLQSVDRLAQVAIDARSQVRESYAASLTSYDVARHLRDEVIPLRKTISDEVLLRYNGMLASTFELLADAREQVSAVNGYIGALKDYWLADTDLRQALGASVPSPASVPTSTSPRLAVPAAGSPAAGSPGAGSARDDDAGAVKKPAAATPHEQDH